MIIEINYKALHWNNHQGGSGVPFTGRILTEVPPQFNIAELMEFAANKLDIEKARNITLIGDYIMTNVVIDA
jgi:hypothetical protein